MTWGLMQLACWNMTFPGRTENSNTYTDDDDDNDYLLTCLFSLGNIKLISRPSLELKQSYPVPSFPDTERRAVSYCMPGCFPWRSIVSATSPICFCCWVTWNAKRQQTSVKNYWRKVSRKFRIKQKRRRHLCLKRGMIDYTVLSRYIHGCPLAYSESVETTIFYGCLSFISIFF